MRGLWYSFTAGSVRVISLNNDDICYQDGGNSYVRGYSGGTQRRLLESALKAAQQDRDIDWVVVCMHQTAVSTAIAPTARISAFGRTGCRCSTATGSTWWCAATSTTTNAAHPIRGTQPNDTRTPIPVDTRLDVVDTTKGTVHLVIGGGGMATPTNGVLFPEPRCRVLTGVGGPPPPNEERQATDLRRGGRAVVGVPRPDQPYGFVAFTVDPGTGPGSRTAIDATYYAVKGPYGEIEPVDRFRLVKPRRD